MLIALYTFSLIDVGLLTFFSSADAGAVLATAKSPDLKRTVSVTRDGHHNQYEMLSQEGHLRRFVAYLVRIYTVEYDDGHPNIELLWSRDSRQITVMIGSNVAYERDYQADPQVGPPMESEVTLARLKELFDRGAISGERYYFEKGIRENSESDWDSAIESFSKVVDLNPSNDAAWFGLAATEVEVYEKRDALKHFTMAIQIDPTNPRYYWARGDEEIEDDYNSCLDKVRAWKLGEQVPTDDCLLESVDRKPIAVRAYELIRNTDSPSFMGLRLHSISSDQGIVIYDVMGIVLTKSDAQYTPIGQACVRVHKVGFRRPNLARRWIVQIGGKEDVQTGPNKTQSLRVWRFIGYRREDALPYLDQRYEAAVRKRGQWRRHEVAIEKRGQ
jgi:tetratricopeptide (TPR) repeat protein